MADYSASSTGVTVDLTGVLFTEGFGGDAEGDTYSGVEDFVGSALGDILLGAGGTNTLLGGLDDDILNGGDGNDILNGGADDDTLKGAGGVDTMTGATGEDVFQFFDYDVDANADSSVGAGNRDIITDFRPGFDQIDLSDIDSHIGGGDGFTFIGTDTFAVGSGPNGEVRYFYDNVNNVTIVQVDRENDGNLDADFEIELTGNIVLTTGDFIL